MLFIAVDVPPLEYVVLVQLVTFPSATSSFSRSSTYRYNRQYKWITLWIQEPIMIAYRNTQRILVVLPVPSHRKLEWSPSDINIRFFIQSSISFNPSNAFLSFRDENVQGPVLSFKKSILSVAHKIKQWIHMYLLYFVIHATDTGLVYYSHLIVVAFNDKSLKSRVWCPTAKPATVQLSITFVMMIDISCPDRFMKQRPMVVRN